MRILFNHGTPDALHYALGGHFVGTAYEMGWLDLDNGEQFRQAKKRFDFQITTDLNLP
jgi:hypothetical protein